MRAREAVEVGGVNLQSKVVAVALRRRSQAASRASIAHVGGDGGISRHAVPPPPPSW